MIDSNLKLYKDFTFNVSLEGVPAACESTDNILIDPKNTSIEHIVRSYFELEDVAVDYCETWHKRTIHFLHDKQLELDEILSLHKLQKLISKFYENYLEPILNSKSFILFNDWLDSNGHGDWYAQLTVALLKMPFRAVKTILTQLYSLLKDLYYYCAHPEKALIDAATFIVYFIKSLTQSETYVKMGAGILGASLGQPLILLQPPVLITVVLGTTLLISALVHDILKTLALKSSWQDVKEMLLEKHLTQITKAFGIGLLSGIAAGIFSRILFSFQPVVTNNAQAGEYVKAYWCDHHIPPNYLMHNFVKDRNVILVFSDSNLPFPTGLDYVEKKIDGLVTKIISIPLPLLQKVSEMAVQAFTQIMLLE